MAMFDNLFPNTFSKFFIKNKEHTEVTRAHLEDKNSQGTSVQQYDNSLMNINSGAYDMAMSYASFSPIINDKKARVQKYREMALFSEVNNGLDNVCNDAIRKDPITGMIANVNFIERHDNAIPDVVKKRIQNAFDYVYHDVLHFNKDAKMLFRKWIVDSELYIEWVLNNTGTSIIGYQELPSFTCAPIYGNKGSRIDGYIQLIDEVIQYSQPIDKTNEDAVLFQANQISYISYPLRGSSKIDVRGYLDPAIRPYNLLRSVEDAVVVYRLVRAPERRIWNIYTGNLPKTKAEEYIKGLQIRYKKKMVFNSTDGYVDQTQNVQSMLEDFWFSTDSAGQGTKVETLQAGMNLGEITDLDYLLKKLYSALKIPLSRTDPTAQYTGGKIGEVSREEVRFGEFVYGLQERFKYILLEPLFVILKMRGIDEKYISEGLIDVQFTQSNFFKEYLENDLISTKLSTLSSVATMLWSPENANGLFHPDFVLKQFVGLTDQQIEMNSKMIAMAKLSLANPTAPTTPGAEGGFGGAPEMGGGAMPDLSGSSLPPENETPIEANPEEIAKTAENPEVATPGAMGMTVGEPSDFGGK